MEEIILDASIILDNESRRYIRELIDEGEFYNAVLPASFLQSMVRPEHIRRWAEFLGLREGIDIGDVLRFREIAFSLPRFEGSVYPNEEVFGNLLEITQDELIARCLAEEWEFVTRHSWLFARLRKSLDTIVEAGNTGVQYSRKTFSKVTRKLIGKGEHEPLTPNDKLKATAKWIAFSGPLVWAAFEPFSGAAASLVGNVIIMTDP